MEVTIICTGKDTLKWFSKTTALQISLKQVG